MTSISLWLSTGVYWVAIVRLLNIGTASRPQNSGPTGFLDEIAAASVPIKYHRFSELANEIKSQANNMDESMGKMADLVQPVYDAAVKYGTARDKLQHAAEHFETRAIPKAFLTGVGEKQAELKNFMADELWSEALPGHLKDLADSRGRDVSWELTNTLSDERMNEKFAQKFNPDRYTSYLGHGGSSIGPAPVVKPYGGRTHREMFEALKHGNVSGNIEVHPGHLETQTNESHLVASGTDHPETLELTPGIP